jgi:hypothetical protein
MKERADTFVTKQKTGAANRRARDIEAELRQPFAFATFGARNRATSGTPLPSSGRR